MMKRSLYLETADKIAAYIKENKVQAGDRLPTYREFAELFGVSMHTVGSALECLQSKGVVDIHKQSGVFIMEEAYKALYPNSFDWSAYLKKTDGDQLDMHRRLSEAWIYRGSSSKRYELSNLELSTEFGAHDLWKRSLNKALENLSPNDLQIPAREELAKYSDALTDYMKYYGLDMGSGSVLLAKGTNYSLLFLILTFFAPGTICYYVSPSKLDASLLFEMARLIRTPIPTDSEGIDIKYFSERVGRKAKSVVVVLPELELSGVTMSMRRRRELYHLCFANSIPIIEVDEYRGYRSQPLPPIKTMDKHGIVFYVNTFANTLNNSSEVGWIFANRELIEHLRYVRLSFWTNFEVLPHRVIYEALVSGEYRSYLTKLQAEMRKREEKLNSLLDEYLGDIATWNRNSEAFFWVKFKKHIDARKIAQNDEGLAVAEFSQYAFAENNSVLICLPSMDMNDLRGAVKQLAYLARKSVRA